MAAVAKITLHNRTCCSGQLGERGGRRSLTEGHEVALLNRLPPRERKRPSHHACLVYFWLDLWRTEASFIEAEGIHAIVRRRPSRRGDPAEHADVVRNVACKLLCLSRRHAA